MPAPTANPSIWRRLRTPRLTLIVAGLLLLDAIGTAGVMEPRGCSMPPAFPIVDTPDGPALASEDSVTEQGDLREIIGTVHLAIRRRSTAGFWAETARVIDPRYRVYMHDGTPLTPELDARFRPGIAGEIERCWGDTELADLIRAGAGPVSRPIIGGYIHNAATLGLAAIFLWSLRWVGYAQDDYRRREARAAGLCPSCGYSLAGLPSGPCPECGLEDGPRGAVGAPTMSEP